MYCERERERGRASWQIIISLDTHSLSLSHIHPHLSHTHTRANICIHIHRLPCVRFIGSSLTYSSFLLSSHCSIIICPATLHLTSSQLYPTPPPTLSSGTNRMPVSKRWHIDVTHIFSEYLEQKTCHKQPFHNKLQTFAGYYL